MNELLSIIKRLKLTKEEVLEEAACVEYCGEWYHMSLMGYRAETLREAAELM